MFQKLLSQTSFNTTALPLLQQDIKWLLHKWIGIFTLSIPIKINQLLAYIGYR